MAAEATATVVTRSGEADHGVVVKSRRYHAWVEKNIPDLSGKVAIVTGGNSGLGFWAANALAGKGCTVVLACRNVAKGNAAKEEVIGYHPHAQVDVIAMDNMDLATVHSFAETFNSKYERLDFLLNNAGIMAQPFQKSTDGFDVQFQTNHLAHFLLTQLLWDKMMQTEGQSRVVNHASFAHATGGVKFSKDKMEKPDYDIGYFGFNICLWNAVFPLGIGKNRDYWTRYCSSKLCNVLFTKEMERRLKSKGVNLDSKIMTASCHPGYSNTNLMNVAGESYVGWKIKNKLFSQSPADGCLPLLKCVVSDKIKNGDYVGPKYWLFGSPKRSQPCRNGKNEKMAKELWEYSEECAKVSFNI
ncbi:Short-chain dehydrogenase TIC 32, chloroplastic [Seminavis robusta]|uniref:Short-chain dehydrogenase TIC 32, chloroplastic n=1 Tax=Seminavis robusta TaxID=568900 RepID=A0A9N8ECN0_9STRA|nr:Short-chain dehydrogenase TIC 32, chloroplastic [Seminavis robusta]|eukprot:Sro896_g217300.1 Short-chain dehydrogenase TIC 32, chloroplastic (357) ;mRNA; r:8881-9951